MYIQNNDSGCDDTTASEDGAPAEQPKEAKAEAKTNATKKKKKSRQKQKKVAGSLASTRPSVTAKQNSKAQPVAPDEDIDSLLASLNITQAAVPEASTSGRTITKARTDEPVLLGVNPSKLKADDEMRKIFGSKVVDAEARNDQAGGMVGENRRIRRYYSQFAWQFAMLRALFLLSCLS